ncbi:hypothetical protein BCR37DRAFT_24543 [Protomyces lactucae-debilis]|uniref:Uncharacterized protein n=1 Tax=Protomyces lactucae-debilis TaxID=2754530 RepID=A0A1Y2FGL6_PROLT|nr:uncharacterized protein BCR37DRAFT_24543 [Protomyces lactucae-debilis]ORY81955.1 hypothetical protein BCR37DRAFT_24543 [Protomyces lactucae-debilis]
MPQKKTASSRASAPRRTAPYSHNNYVCETCRKAHRRCKHDPGDDPTYDPTKKFKRIKNQGQEGSTSPGASGAIPQPAVTSVPRSAGMGLNEQGKNYLRLQPPSSPRLSLTSELSSGSMLLTASTGTSFPNTAHAYSMDYEQLFMEVFDAFVTTPMPVQCWQSEWRAMLELSPALRAGSVCSHMLYKPCSPAQIQEALEYKREANLLVLSEPNEPDTEYWRRATGIFLVGSLAYCEFTSQAPHDAFMAALTNLHPFLLQYVQRGFFPPALAALPFGDTLERFPVLPRAVAALPHIAQPFFELFPHVDFYTGWSTGNIQNLMSITLDACLYMQDLPGTHGKQVRSLVARLMTFNTFREVYPCDVNPFVVLMTTTVYTLAILLEYPDRERPSHLRQDLQVKLDLVERSGPPIAFTRSVIGILDGENSLARVLRARSYWA